MTGRAGTRLAAGAVAGCSLALLGACLVAAAPWGAHARGAPAARPAAGVPSACQATVRSQAKPALLLLGEETTVSHRLWVDCAGPAIPLHVVLVLDASKSMSGAELNDAKAAAIQLIRDMELPEHPKRRVGVVQFNTVAKVRCELTDDVGQAIGCVNAITAGGDTAIDAGIAAGTRVLRTGTGPIEEKSQPLQVMVALSDGKNNAGCSPVLREAGRAKGQGAVLSTVCAGPSCDAVCLRQAATNGQLFYEASHSGMLGRIFRFIVQDVLEVRARHVTLFSTLADDMAYVAGSAQPVPAAAPAGLDPGLPTGPVPAGLDPGLSTGPVPAGNGGTLTWSFQQVPAEGVTVTYRVRPLAAGSRVVARQAGGDFDDSLQRAGRFELVSPMVAALRAWAVPTPGPGEEPTPTPRPR